MEKIRKDRHHSQTMYDLTTSRATSRVNSVVTKMLNIAICDTYYEWKRFSKIAAPETHA